MIDELEWPIVDKSLSSEERDKAVEEVIELVIDVDGILKAQSSADIDYFTEIAGSRFNVDQIGQLKKGVHQAYRWQYIISGVEHPRFVSMLNALTTEDQRRRLTDALSSLL